MLFIERIKWSHQITMDKNIFENKNLIKYAFFCISATNCPDFVFSSFFSILKFICFIYSFRLCFSLSMNTIMIQSCRLAKHFNLADTSVVIASTKMVKIQARNAFKRVTWTKETKQKKTLLFYWFLHTMCDNESTDLKGKRKFCWIKKRRNEI